jgi:hypothetical protein
MMGVQRIDILNLSTTTKLTVLDCVCCGVIFGITADFEERRRKDHKSFFCPNGHSQAFNQRTTEDRLKRDLAAARGNLRHREELLETERKRSAAYKGIANREKKAHLSGACPVCEKHLDSAKRLAAHIKSQHPDYVGEVDLKKISG